jgi:hypothetical protein
MATRQLSPFELNIEGVDLKAMANTQYQNTDPLDVTRDFAYTAVVTVVNVGGGSNGAAKLTIEVLEKDKTTVAHSVDILTAIDTKTSGTTRNVVKWGYGTIPTVDGAATLDSDGAEVLALARYINVVLEVTTASDGTSSVADVHFFSESI